jgi:hypothetical protein
VAAIPGVRLFSEYRSVTRRKLETLTHREFPDAVAHARSCRVAHSEFNHAVNCADWVTTPALPNSRFHKRRDVGRDRGSQALKSIAAFEHRNYLSR